MRYAVVFAALYGSAASAADIGLRLLDTRSTAGSTDTAFFWQVDVSGPSASNPISPGFVGSWPAFEFGFGSFYVASSDNNNELFVFDGTTGALTNTLNMTFPVGGDVVTSLEFVGNTLYGGFTTEDGGPSSLVTIDTTTGDVALVGATGIAAPTGGLAWDGDTLYTVNSGRGGAATLYSVSLADGSATAIGEVRDENGRAIQLTGLEFGLDGVLYGLASRGFESNLLLRIDPTTGDATRLGIIQGAASQTTSITTVPEPASLMLLGLGGLVCLRRRHA